jgi:hypothetical protein
MIWQSLSNVKTRSPVLFCSDALLQRIASSRLHRESRSSTIMPFTIATWNINSVRLRIGAVTRFLETWKPGVLPA